MSLGPENRLYLKNKGFRTILSCKLNIVFILKQANTNQIGLFQRFRTGTRYEFRGRYFSYPSTGPNML